MSSDFPLHSALDLIKGFSKKDFTPTEVILEVIERAESTQATTNAFSEIDAEKAIDFASASSQRWQSGKLLGVLDGIPVAVKDTLPLKGWRTGYGSISGRNVQAAKDDAPLSRSLRHHGAVFFAKTAVPEFAWKGLTDSKVQGITRNPYDLSKTPGGSSGGSAVAVANSVCPIATGADGGGSIRIPASFTGIYGLKPSPNLLPSLPSPLGSMAVVGGLTRNVADTALFLDAAREPDSRDSFSMPPLGIRYQDFLNIDIAGMRVGWTTDFGQGGVDPEVEVCTREAARAMESLGCKVTEVTIDTTHLRPAFKTLWAMSFTEILSRLSDQDAANVEFELLEMREIANTTTGLEVHNAGRACRQFSAMLEHKFRSYDLLLTPSVAILPFDVGALTADSNRFPEWWDWTPFTWPFNMSRNPAASFPFGLSRQGLPIGVQLVGRWYDESTIIKASSALELAIGRD